ncbi:50S ribosomal protein L7/L12 [candidate division WWE3 bacterium CG_4_9_14_0_2_um_filter_35_11]|uniref:Large ribosomal subunit protein bL12 n=1 Tax=candidate division WWE3 bacterium CG_4_9_14_0_2_um_filter_35_11 TaxID=1975077 RepID=A0A2M8EM46_UNCKA|nr:MAG: 50S ribosomal protein L7/L12 [candidate division WWE3 bacterium CG10_big_fil_rev_8_21_14_0_10_35_32]PJC23800.1 MAG: 50S ribosomal protein L7/L12 [candidate division WWE3 bacterium CG_4_9_14_0_2_um_filter_35_11]
MAEDTTKAEVTAEASKPSVKLSGDAQKVMETVGKMTVLELSELVKAMEEKFGVSAAAPVMMAQAVAQAEAVEEKSAYDVVIVSAGQQKIAVIKAVRELDQTLGLVDAKNLVEKGNAVILTGAKKEAAEEAKGKLEAAGAKVELR